MASNEAHLVRPRTPPCLDIPYSTNTVDVRLIDTKVESKFFGDVSTYLHPATPGFSKVDFPVFAFLVSHKSNRHVLFDNGIRRDWQNMPPRVVGMVKSFLHIDSLDSPANILNSDKSNFGVTSKEIEAVIWSHTHFDHTGDMKEFPASTDLVVGPGVKATAWPGYPTDPDALTLDSDAEGRNVREINFNTRDNGELLMVAGFPAHDYFGDGSLYLLDAPGHAQGHICALARVTPSPAVEKNGQPPSTFVFLGADACHHPGALRPTEYLPLPRQVVPSPFPTDRARGVICLGDTLRDLLAHKSPNRPVFELTNRTCADLKTGRSTLRRIQELDAEGRTLIVLAHDRSLLDHVSKFPDRLNNWYSESLGKKTRWAFFACYDGCVRD